MSGKAAERTYSASEIEERLERELPRWSLSDGHLTRKFTTGGWKATLMAVNAIGHLAEAAWHHPDLKVSYSSVEVALTTHSAKGITDKDFSLARKIEEVVLWQPAKEGILEGTPSDPRYAYIKYEG